MPHGKHLRVHSGDFVRAGEALVDGPLVPHDILRISGEEAVQQYLIREIQNVYRSQRVEINDKHIEIIVARMLRKVRIETAGDTNLLPGSVMDKFDFRQVNDESAKCVKITRQGRQRVRRRRDRAQGRARAGQRADRSARRRRRPRARKPKPATASTQLLGITKAAVQSSSFISAASFQETTKVLTEAALAGKVDHLVGLKENVILGHLIPAGTGFRTIQESEVRIRPEALEALAAEKDRVLERAFPLLESAVAAGDARQRRWRAQRTGPAATAGARAASTPCWAAAMPDDRRRTTSRFSRSIESIRRFQGGCRHVRPRLFLLSVNDSPD